MTRHHTHKKMHTAAKPLPKREKIPDYVIKISDPKVLRKDILESLREVIIFMQGYEKFRKIQEEKVATIAILKEQVKEAESLIAHHLRKYFPVGKLKPIKESQPHISIVAGSAHSAEEDEVSAPALTPTYQQEKPAAVSRSKSNDELEELESQLQEIEQQLQNI